MHAGREGLPPHDCSHTTHSSPVRQLSLRISDRPPWRGQPSPLAATPVFCNQRDDDEVSRQRRRRDDACWIHSHLVMEQDCVCTFEWTQLSTLSQSHHWLCYAQCWIDLFSTVQHFVFLALMVVSILCSKNLFPWVRSKAPGVFRGFCGNYVK